MIIEPQQVEVQKPPLILLIEDNHDFHVYMSTVLKQAGYEILIASNGEQGIALAEEHLPDLIVCDIMMPSMTGHEVLERLHSQSRTVTIPFIFLTALANPADLREGMGLGADDYLTKPVRPKDLVRAVDVRLRRSQNVRMEIYERFAQQLVQVQERERERTAMMLHERVNQTLMGLKLSLSLLDSGTSKSDPVYTDTRLQIDSLMNLVEAMAQELHPTMLTDLEFDPAVRWLISQYKLDVKFSTDNMDYRFDPAVEIAAFRILQSALDNVQQHARTHSVVIELAYRDCCLEIMIEDHGVGFDLESVLQSPHNLDLLTMYHRAAIVGGKLQISSSPGSGTRIYASFPQSEAARYPQPIAQSVLSSALQRGQMPVVPPPTEQDTRIVIAIEPPLQRQGLRRLLSSSPHLNLVAEVGSLDDVRAAVSKHHPDVLIINPVADGKKQQEILQCIAECAPEVRMLVIATQTSPEYVVNALSHGALGYVPINTTMTDLNTAIVNVARGRMYLSPLINQQQVVAKLQPFASEDTASTNR